VRQSSKPWYEASQTARRHAWLDLIYVQSTGVIVALCVTVASPADDLDPAVFTQQRREQAYSV